VKLASACVTAALVLGGVPADAQFTDIGAGLAGVGYGSAAWGDYDNDGDLDILLTGNYSARVYRNDGAGAFVDVGAGLAGVNGASGAWGDCDNDGDLDIILTGAAGADPYAAMYRNDDGVFTDFAAGLAPVRYGAVAWGDYDNDGDLDLVLTGSAQGGAAVARLYRNYDGGFTDVGAALQGVSYSAVAWGDYDNDGDLDLLLAGTTTGSARLARLYRNDGQDVFTDVGAGLPGFHRGSAAWGDYDDDGDLDVLLTGDTGSGYVARVFRNGGAAGFTDIGAVLQGVISGSAAWGDYDDDGDLDIVLSGDSGSGYVARIHRNDGGGAFTDIGAGLEGVSRSYAAWGDYDNDGDLDLLLTGHTGAAYLTRIYRNDGGTANAPPTAPANIRAVRDGSQLTLSWDPAGDDHTPSSALTYNLRVGRTPGSADLVTPMSSAAGYRRIPALGNAQHGTTAVLRSLPPAAYYWSVQAVDTAFSGSAFAVEGSLCLYAISPDGIAAPATGAIGTVNVETGASLSCAWTAVSNVPWITVTSGASGSGDGTVGYAVAPNSGAARTGTVTIEDQAFTVTQAAAPTVVIAPRSKTVTGSYTANGGVTYAITLTNSGTATQADALGHELVDTLPPSLSLVVASATSGIVTTDISGNGVAWDVSIPLGASVTITIAATVSPTVAAGERISNQATIFYDADLDGTNDSTALTDDPSVAGPDDPTTFVVASPSTAFHTVTPCRLVDTRNGTGTYGGPALAAGLERVFPLFDQCGIPATARALSLNLTATQSTSAGNLRLYPAGTTVPTVSSINFTAGRTRANNTVVGLNGLGELAVYCGQASGTVHFVLDVNGYFQ
jgi:uncharacterized repeat protein (TIGR01451 family)